MNEIPFCKKIVSTFGQFLFVSVSRTPLGTPFQSMFECADILSYPLECADILFYPLECADILSAPLFDMRTLL
jgi:hypothetical protein